MSVEIMIYVYLFVCFSMIVFNIATAIVLKKKDKRTERVSRDFALRVEEQIEMIKNGEHCEAEHKKYLSKKLKRIGNMSAFDKMLEQAYVNDPETIKNYLTELDSVLISLCGSYCGKDKIEAAYFPYIIKKYRLISFRAFPSVTEMLIGMLDEPSIYCRENAMQALYTTGDSECVIRALQKIDRSELFYHGKLISDGLLNFAGSTSELDGKLIECFDGFSVGMRVNLFNYIRFSSADYKEFAFSVLCDKTQNDEIRYCAIRYLGKYRYDEAYDELCRLAAEKDAEKWQYSAIASTALAIYPGERSVELLKSNLYSRNWYIRFNSAESLERLGVTYSQLADILDGEDRYAAEILRYRLECNERSATAV